MSYVMLMDQDVSDDVNGYTAFGEAIVGGEGSTSGPPDIYTGSDESDYNYDYVPWGGNVDDGGLNTGSVTFKLDANLATGVDVLTVAGHTVTYNGGASGTVGSVEIRVGADVAAQVSLQNISVRFLQGGAEQEYDSAPGLFVDTTNPSGPSAQEAAMIVTPNSQANDEVVVRGSLQMNAADGTYACMYDLFCQAFIKPAAAGANSGTSTTT
ncbi:MAG TPA: hypothetical protein VGI81_05790 [Tepidisphaeraceae bacterium]|jgi:hypothetical protein